MDRLGQYPPGGADLCAPGRWRSAPWRELWDFRGLRSVPLQCALPWVLLLSTQSRCGEKLGGLLGRAWSVGIAEVAIESSGWRPALRMSSVEIKILKA